MENKIIKCSMEEHKENNAISFCQECKIYLCNKCEKLHQGLFKKHHKFELNNDNNILEVFTGLCKENNHLDELEYFCKTNNKLCCAKCITKIKDGKNGQHTDCDICSIKDIENEKKNKLQENIKQLENLSINLENSINQLKTIFEKINKSKEELKMKIQNIFTKLRNSLNDREDELLSEVDKIYDISFFNEDIIKQSEKLPNKIKTSLEKGKIVYNEWNNNNNNNLSSLINDCLIIENNINNIKDINENIKNIIL